VEVSGMRIYLSDGTDEMAALHAAIDAGYATCVVRYSDELGFYIDVDDIDLVHQLNLLAAVLSVDPTASTTALRPGEEGAPARA